jgi:TetR/AcrR family transcriptional regulator
MKDNQTKELIMNAAKNIFFKKGDIHATTQDIADEAGVNRALIHYYFSSREQLYEMVLKDASREMSQRIQKAFAPGASFREKMDTFLTIHINELLEYPFLENFIIAEFNRAGGNKMQLLSKEVAGIFMETFVRDLLEEMERGTIVRMSPEQFLINIVSLCSYPLIARPLLQQVFDLDDAAYLDFIKKRKEQIMMMIFRD